MRVLKYSSVLLLIITMCTSATGRTMDNPTSSENGKPKKILDPRFAQKINYKAVGKTVEQVLRELSEMTGVKLKAGYNDLDWQVRDRKMVIAVKDAPLGNLMNSISHTMKFNWSIDSDVDPPTYRLYMDRKLLLEANHLMKEQLDVLKQDIDEKRQRELAEILNLADTSPEQLAEIKKKNPRMYLLAKSGAMKSFADLMKADPGLYETLLAGQEVDVMASSLSPTGRQALLRFVEDLARPDKLMSSFQRPQSIPPDYASHLGRIQIRINPELSESLLNPLNRGLMTGAFVVRYGGWRSGFVLYNPDSSQLVSDKMKLKMAEEGIPWTEAFQAYELEYQQSRVAERKTDPSGEPLIEHPKDPDLEVKVKLEVKKQRLGDYQLSLADKSGFGVVSDSFESWPESIGFSKAEVSIRTVLDKIQDSYHYNWEKYGQILEFRDRFWYWKRSAQIPEAWLEDWRNALKEKGTLDLDKLIQVSYLTLEQYNFNIPGDEVFAGDTARVMGNCGEWGCGLILQAYGKMDSSERKKLFTDEGIWVSDVSPEAQVFLGKYFAKFSPGYLDDPQPNIRMTATRKKLNRQFKYVFRLTPDNDCEPIQFDLTTPKYELKPDEPENNNKAESTGTTSNFQRL